MTAPTSAEIEGEMRGAHAALKEAQGLLEQKGLAGATSRAYYAAFHAARAVLWSRGFVPKSHKGLLRQFSENLVKPGIIDVEFSKIFHDLFDERDLADYHVATESFSVEEVKTLVEHAKLFVEEMSKHIEGKA